MPLLVVLLIYMILPAVLRLEVRRSAAGWDVVTLTWRQAMRRMIG